MAEKCQNQLTFLSKLSADIFTNLLYHGLNNALYSFKLLSEMKLANFKLVFKKVNHIIVDRPVTILPNLKKIFERYACKNVNIF